MKMSFLFPPMTSRWDRSCIYVCICIVRFCICDACVLMRTGEVSRLAKSGAQRRLVEATAHGNVSFVCGLLGVTGELVKPSSEQTNSEDGVIPWYDDDI